MSADPTAPSVGARVKLHSLQQTPKHNGVEGEVLEFMRVQGAGRSSCTPTGFCWRSRPASWRCLPLRSSCAAQTSKYTRSCARPSSTASAARWLSPRILAVGGGASRLTATDGSLLKPANLVLIRKHAPMVPRPGAQAGLTEEQRRLATRLNEPQVGRQGRRAVSARHQGHGRQGDTRMRLLLLQMLFWAIVCSWCHWCCDSLSEGGAEGGCKVAAALLCGSAHA
jgi:hypothetical protein